jgi:hypothetical protein
MTILESTGGVAALRPAVFKPREARVYLGGIGLNKLRQLVADGEIEAVSDGHRWFPTVESCDRYLARLPRAVMNNPYLPAPRKASS